MTDAPGRASFIGRPRIHIGKPSLQNKLECFKEIKFDWCNKDINDDRLKQEPKETILNLTTTKILVSI